MKLAVRIIFLSILISLALFSCGKQGKTVLRVGTSAEYPPFSYKNGDQLVGIDIDIARKIAETMNTKIEIYPMTFDALFSALASDKIDMAISSITITPERSKRYDFSTPYAITNQVLVAKDDCTIVIDKFEDFGKYTIGTLAATTGYEYLVENLVDRDLMPKASIKQYPSALQSINELLQGNVDFVIIDDSAAAGYEKINPIKIVYTVQTNEAYGIAMQKGRSINETISKSLKELISSGEVKRIIQSYTK
ncbi:MAG: ABC transporter substrate-binding protein [Candidatus Cloacimonetes bacterium]|nr:ABC transporter substrate-binding protein [Candidatus Cloacimonadota bacterium]MDD3235442.1 ABC transporter substrate-binding protein [Candidatus Cloacimonadota bacterium]